MIVFARRGDVITARFTSPEAALLRSFAAQLIEMLTERSAEAGDPSELLLAQIGIGGETELPRDPALARLLPDAYRGDAEAASDHRRFTEKSLVERKIANARSVSLSLTAPPSGLRRTVAVRLTEPEVQSWLRTLTDLRLVMAARLQIVSDGDTGQGDPQMGLIYDWLGFLQGTLLEAFE